MRPTPTHEALVETLELAVLQHGGSDNADRCSIISGARKAVLDALAAPVLSDNQKRELITNYFEETRDVNAAMHLLHDYHRLIAQQPTPAATAPPRIEAVLDIFTKRMVSLYDGMSDEQTEAVRDGIDALVFGIRSCSQ